jgi:hypothetical protein
VVWCLWKSVHWTKTYLGISVHKQPVYRHDGDISQLLGAKNWRRLKRSWKLLSYRKRNSSTWSKYIHNQLQLHADRHQPNTTSEEIRLWCKIPVRYCFKAYLCVHEECVLIITASRVIHYGTILMNYVLLISLITDTPLSLTLLALCIFLLWKW